MSKVMLVEDDPTMLALLETLLLIEGFQVVQLQSEDDLLSAMYREPPDLVLLDVHLKGSDGFDLLRQIRGHAQLAGTRVLMTSGMDLGESCLRAGADGFILKPYMPDELIRMVKELITM